VDAAPAAALVERLQEVSQHAGAGPAARHAHFDRQQRAALGQRHAVDAQVPAAAGVVVVMV
jgi:hypothetical protein